MDRRRLLDEMKRAIAELEAGQGDAGEHILSLARRALMLYGQYWREHSGLERPVRADGIKDFLERCRSRHRAALHDLLKPLAGELSTAAGVNMDAILDALLEVNAGNLPKFFDPNPAAQKKPSRQNFERNLLDAIADLAATREAEAERSSSRKGRKVARHKEWKDHLNAPIGTERTPVELKSTDQENEALRQRAYYLRKHHPALYALAEKFLEDIEKPAICPDLERALARIEGALKRIGEDGIDAGELDWLIKASVGVGGPLFPLDPDPQMPEKQQARESEHRLPWRWRQKP